MVDVREIIQEMTALRRAEAFRHYVRIHSELHEERPHVLADRVQLQQVFMNLVVSEMLNKQIASEIGASEATVKVHRGHVMQKMQAASVVDLVRMADKLKLSPRK